MVNKINFSKFSYLISDWDGTLADSVKPYTESYVKTTTSEFGTPENKAREIFANTAGAPLTMQIKWAAEAVGIKLEDTLPYENKFWENLDGLKPDIIPGVKKFLALLKRRGLKIAVWSGTKPGVLKEKVKLLSLSSLVDYCIGNEPGNTKEVKGPALFLKIAKKFKVSEQELRQKAIVIGDGTGDMEAGKAVRATTVGIARNQPKEQLIKAGADMVVMDIEELGRLFE